MGLTPNWELGHAEPALRFVPAIGRFLGYLPGAAAGTLAAQTFIGTKSRATWWCAANEVCSRLWAGSVLGRRASRTATAVLDDVILRGRVVGFPLIATEGFEYSVGVSERLFGSACVYGHVLKTRRNDRVVRVERRRRIGTAGRLKAARWESEDSETLHTSFVERLNLTIRQGSAYLRRRSPCHWAADHNMELVFTPTYASWLNRIEAIFSGVRYFALANSDYPDHEHSRRAILAYVAWRNRHRHTELVKRREKHKMSFATRH